MLQRESYELVRLEHKSKPVPLTEKLPYPKGKSKYGLKVASYKRARQYFSILEENCSKKKKKRETKSAKPPPPKPTNQTNKKSLESSQRKQRKVEMGIIEVTTSKP